MNREVKNAQRPLNISLADYHLHWGMASTVLYENEHSELISSLLQAMASLVPDGTATVATHKDPDTQPIPYLVLS